MILFKSANTLNTYIKEAHIKERSVGFVPTMGALHKGHISLIEQSISGNDLTVCSIFINPTQFNNPDDFTKYPVTIERDIDMLEESGCDVLFLPEAIEIYPPGFMPKKYALGELETILEGKYRPGHFQGVCQVVDRLLEIVSPDKLYLGQKDFQQCMVIKKLTGLLRLNTELVICPTLREKDGLAMSSRNTRLDAEDREKAVMISKVLFRLKQEIKPGSLVTLKEKASAFLTAAGFVVDYVEMADAENLSAINTWDGITRPVALVAASLHHVRLIDNLLL